MDVLPEVRWSQFSHLTVGYMKFSFSVPLTNMFLTTEWILGNDFARCTINFKNPVPYPASVMFDMNFTRFYRPTFLAWNLLSSSATALICFYIQFVCISCELQFIILSTLTWWVQFVHQLWMARIIHVCLLWRKKSISYILYTVL